MINFPQNCTDFPPKANFQKQNFPGMRFPGNEIPHICLCMQVSLHNMVYILPHLENDGDVKVCLSTNTWRLYIIYHLLQAFNSHTCFRISVNARLFEQFSSRNKDQATEISMLFLWHLLERWLWKFVSCWKDWEDTD